MNISVWTFFLALLKFVDYGKNPLLFIPIFIIISILLQILANLEFVRLNLIGGAATFCCEFCWLEVIAAGKWDTDEFWLANTVRWWWCKLGEALGEKFVSLGCNTNNTKTWWHCLLLCQVFANCTSFSPHSWA